MRANPASAHIDTADKLFEYFLMDVEMEPCMQTSRIRHALSSVQLFIERCLMNLETGVSPSSIIAKRWEWMKRYRVWEANRKVFLFPENWLEPELRDDKSPFFKEIESQLLQSDITEESATTALLTYLTKLEEVAKLEPCGIYHIEATAQTAEIDHVIARSAGANRKYYYRRREYGYWTPWEEIKLDIEDNPVTPVIWNNRLLLFWLRILKEGPPEPKQPPSDKLLTELKTNNLPGAPSVETKAVLCWSEYYKGKWQPTKTSDVNEPTRLGSYTLTGYNAFIRSQLLFDTSVEGDPNDVAGDALRVGFYGSGGSSFLLYNTHSLPVREEEEPRPFDFKNFPPVRIMDIEGDPFIVYYFKAGTPLFLGIPIPTHKRAVLENERRDRIVEPHHTLQNPWEAPFFYEDSRHVFFVTTEKGYVPVYDHQDFGFTLDPGVVNTGKIPPLVFEEEPRPGPKLWGDGDPVGPDLSVVNPNPLLRFISEDANIRLGIGATGDVRYNGSRIGPSGMIPDASGKR
jgi:hypothetical protein